MTQRKVMSAREVMKAGGVDPEGPFEVGPFPAEMRMVPVTEQSPDMVERVAPRYAHNLVKNVALAIDGELPLLEAGETLKAAAFAALEASCHAELRQMVVRLLARMGVDSCAYEAELCGEAEALLASIGDRT